MRTGLAGSAIPVPDKESNEFAGRNHSIQRKRDGLGVNCAGCWNGLAFLTAVFDVKAHGLEDAFLGRVNRFAEAVNTGKIIAISEVSLSLAFDGNGVAVESHARCKLTMHTGKFAIRCKEEKPCADW